MEEQKENWTYKIPLYGIKSIYFFNNEKIMKQVTAANPDTLIPVLGGGSCKEMDSHFPGVFAALEKEKAD